MQCAEDRRASTEENLYMWLQTSLCIRCNTVHSPHLCKRREMCFHSVSMCATFRLCQITTSAISGSTPVPGGLSVTSAVSQWRGETLQTPSLRNTDCCNEIARPVCVKAPYKSHMTSTTRHHMHTSMPVSYSQAWRHCISQCFLASLPRTPTLSSWKHLQHCT